MGGKAEGASAVAAVGRGRIKNKRVDARANDPNNHFSFLVATKRLYKSVCPSVDPSFPRSVRRYVMISLFGLLGATYAVNTVLFEGDLQKAKVSISPF